MGKALYRTYRSTSFDEVLGQDHIVKVLQNTLAQGTVSHAYLLTGPRGVGKTSVARILALAVNDLPYEKDASHIDIIEIDAASNRRIDEIRELRERVHIAPTSAKYKVYIIDEVHMLTKEAFNALLKTLEEPPAHVIFILATTDFHKLPETIVSRCLRLTFKPIEAEQVVSHLRTIAEQEKFQVEDAALELIARHGRGSFRDSISLLDQVRNVDGVVTLKVVEHMLGLASESTIQAIVESVRTGDIRALMQNLESAYTAGGNENELAKQLGQYIRADLIGGSTLLSQDEAFALLKELLHVPASNQSRAQLELVLLGTTLLHASPTSNIAEKVPKEKVAQAVSTPPIITIAPESASEAEQIESPKPPEPTTHAVIEEQLTDTDELWHSVLQSLKSKNNTLYGVARMATVTRDDDALVLSFKFAFHYRKIGDSKSKAIIWEIIQAKSPEIVELQVAHLPQQGAPVMSETIKPEAPKQTYENITNIFGSTEVLES